MTRKTGKTISKLLALSVAILMATAGCNLKEKVEELIVTIGGNISHDGEPVSGALVLLVENTDVTEGLSLANGSVSASDGDYRIIDVEPGTYYVLAVDDTNDNLEFDSDSDRLGFYGIDPEASDLEPDRLTVSDQDVTGADIIYLYNLP